MEFEPAKLDAMEVAAFCIEFFKREKKMLIDVHKLMKIMAFAYIYHIVKNKAILFKEPLTATGGGLVQFDVFERYAPFYGGKAIPSAIGTGIYIEGNEKEALVDVCKACYKEDYKSLSDLIHNNSGEFYNSRIKAKKTTITAEDAPEIYNSFSEGGEDHGMLDILGLAA